MAQTEGGHFHKRNIKGVEVEEQMVWERQNLEILHYLKYKLTALNQIKVDSNTGLFFRYAIKN